MGIHGFMSWLESTNSNAPKTINDYLPVFVGGLWLDCNGIIYKAVQKVYGIDEKTSKSDYMTIASSRPESLKIALFQSIHDSLHEIISTINPVYLLCIAIDGVAPIAKINQQRGRRYKSAQDEIESENTEGMVRLGLVNKNTFDTRSITPGTAFMFELDEWFKLWIKHNREQLPVNVIYSPHTSVGEGEHKIFEFMRQGMFKAEDSSSTPAQVIYGMDADLVLLSLNCSLPRVYLVRENFQQVVDIDALRDKIVKWSTISNENQIDKRIVIQDFIVMVSLIGNDFLPHLISFGGSVASAIEFLISTYAGIREPITNSNGEINFITFSKFMSVIASKEKKLLERAASERYDNPIEAIQQSITRRQKTSEEGNNLDKNEIEIDYLNFRDRWYRKAFSPVSESGVKFLERAGIATLTDRSLEEMCRAYLNGLQWILIYYTKGTSAIDVRYLYRYYYGPLLYDIDLYLKRFIETGTIPKASDVDSSNVYDTNFTYIHQLLSVIPPKSFGVIPERYRHLIESDGVLADMAPLSFSVDYSGTNNRTRNSNGSVYAGTRYKGIALLPFIDVERVIDAVEPYLNLDEIVTTTDSLIVNSGSMTLNNTLQRHYGGRGRGRGDFSRGRGRGDFSGGRGRGDFSGGRGRGDFSGGRGRGDFSGGRGGYRNNATGSDSGRGGSAGERGRGRGGAAGERGRGRGAALIKSFGGGSMM